jgi:hypothetical protein
MLFLNMTGCLDFILFYFMSDFNGLKFNIGPYVVKQCLVVSAIGFSIHTHTNDNPMTIHVPLQFNLFSSVIEKLFHWFYRGIIFTLHMSSAALFVSF